jgi:hypothetical protein
LTARIEVLTSKVPDSKSEYNAFKMLNDAEDKFKGIFDKITQVEEDLNKKLDQYAVSTVTFLKSENFYDIFAEHFFKHFQDPEVLKSFDARYEVNPQSVMKIISKALIVVNEGDDNDIETDVNDPPDLAFMKQMRLLISKTSEINDESILGNSE